MALVRARAEQLREALESAPADAVAVHRARVACRRLRAVFGVLSELSGKRARESQTEPLSIIRRRFGRIRELDVHQAGLERLHATSDTPIEQAAIEHAMEYVARRRRAAERRVGRLQSPSGARLEAGARKALEIAWRGKKAGERALAVVARRLDAVASRLPCLAEEATVEAELHALRIDVKRLRYALELLEPALGGTWPGLIEHTIALQDALGDWHDLALLEALLQRQLDRLTRRQRAVLSDALAQAVARVGAARVAARRRLAAAASSDGPFSTAPGQTEASVESQAPAEVTAAAADAPVEAPPVAPTRRRSPRRTVEEAPEGSA